MSSAQAGTAISSVEVTKISRHGVRLLIDQRELFMSFKEFPWLKKAPVTAVLRVECLRPGHLYWPILDVDLTIDLIEHSETCPLKARSDAQQSDAADPARFAFGSVPLGQLGARLKGLIHKRSGLLLYMVAVACLAVASVLPCVTWGWIDGNSTDNGFQAFASSFLLFFLWPIPAVANTALVLSPFFLKAAKKGRGRWIRCVFAGCAIVEMLPGPKSDRHIGFYLWIVSLLLMAAAFHMLPQRDLIDKESQQSYDH